MKMKNDGELKNLFLEDAGKILDSLRRLFGAFDKKQFDGNLVNQCFRHIHSLKSEAAFLSYTGIVQQTEAMETILASVRSSQRPLEDRELERLRDIFLVLNRDLQAILQGLRLEVAQEVSREKAESLEFSPNDFERVVLKEARERGEKLYRLEASVNRSEPMPYPRLYLLVNNLEVHANVVRLLPPLEVLRKGDRYSVAIVLTTKKDAEAVKRLLDVDQVEGIDVRELAFDEHLGREASLPKERELPRKELRYPRFKRGERKNVSVDHAILETSAFLVSCLAASGPPGNADRGNSRALLTALRERLLSYSGLPCSLAFEKAQRMAEDLARKLGKKIRVECRGDLASFLSSPIFDAVNEILLHLVRNGMDHGIEGPTERTENGKSAEGRIVLESRIKDGTYHLRVADDGRGIRLEEISAAAKTLGLDLPAGADLITCLTHPGFSTRENASAISGRGVGLDIVKGIVTASLGGKLDLVSEPGKGSIFTVSFREEGVRFAAFKAILRDGKVFPFPKELVEEIFPFYAEAAIKTEKGTAYRVGGASYSVLTSNAAEDGVGILFRDGKGKHRIFFAKEVGEEIRVSIEELLPATVFLLNSDESPR